MSPSTTSPTRCPLVLTPVVSVSPQPLSVTFSIAWDTAWIARIGLHVQELKFGIQWTTVPGLDNVELGLDETLVQSSASNDDQSGDGGASTFRVTKYVPNPGLFRWCVIVTPVESATCWKETMSVWKEVTVEDSTT